jgi:glyoxylase-like metal-dependent hydrolase (beta-lactamase superfamily II)
MRRLLLAAAIALLCVLLLASALAWTFSGRAPLEAGTRGAVTTVIDGYVGVSIVDTAAGIVLVDCGADPDGEAIIGALAAAGHTPEDVEAILITHGHSDHIGACHRFPGARIVSIAEEVAHIEGREKPGGPLSRLMPLSVRPFAVTDPLQDGDRFSLGVVTIEVFHLPGHTVGSAAYLVDGVLFLGDSAGLHEDGELSGAPWIFSDDTAQNHEALVALAGKLAPRADEITALVFGHSGPADSIAPLLEYTP